MTDVDGFAFAEQLQQRGVRAPIVMMLTTATRRDERTSGRELRIAAHVTKPIKKSDLYDAVLQALRPGDVRPARADDDARTPAPMHAVAAPARRGQHHQPEADAAAAREGGARGRRWRAPAARRWTRSAQSAFDMVLMDVQMPEMDGFEATAAIRASEQSTGAHIPLIAITAHAMRGDRERCLTAGFDGYVSKPVQFKELFDTIDRLTPADLGAKRRTPIPGGAAPDAGADASTAFDERVALDRTGGDRELLKELIAVFLHEIPNWMQALRGALERRDAAALRATAHAVKGAVDSCGASGAFDAAMLLERIGAEGNLAGAPAALAVLERRIERARAELAAYLARDARPRRCGDAADGGAAMLGGDPAGAGGPDGGRPRRRRFAGRSHARGRSAQEASGSDARRSRRTGARRWPRSPSARPIWC